MRRLRRRFAKSDTHVYEVRPRKDHRGVDLISDALPFGRLWYGEPDAISNAIGYCKVLDNFKAAIALRLPYYNLVKIHGSLRTPAMEAGIENSAWKVSDLVNAA